MSAIPENARYLLVVVSAIACTVGGSTVVGWLLENPYLVQLHPALAPMQMNTALCFVALAAALWALGGGRRASVTVAGLFVAAIGVATLFEYLFAVNLGIDRAIVSPFTVTLTSHPGRMSPLTAGSFVLLGSASALFAQERRARWLTPTACTCAATAAAIGLIALLGYLAGTSAFGTWGPFSRMAAHTAFLVVAVAAALCFATVETWRASNGGALPPWLPAVVLSAPLATGPIFWSALSSDEIPRLRVATLILGALVPIALAWSLNYARVAWGRARSSSEAHRRAQQMLRDAEAQLAHAGRRSVMSEMASGLAHELNQPLGAVVNLLDGSLLRLGRDGLPATADVLAALAKARDEAQRAGRIIHGLRGLTGTGEPSRCAVPVAEIVQEAHELAAGEVRAHRVRLVHLLPEEPVVVLADRVQLLQVLLNLVRNAVEAVRGQVNGHRLVEMVVVLRSDAMVEIVVRDSGCGITRETAERLFTPFFTTRASGLGLGLSISRTIVEAHGGRIWAEPDRERGAAIHFTVPLAAGGRP